MLDFEFQGEVGRIREAFGDNAASSPRMDLVWKFAKDLSRPAFAKIVNHFIATSRHSPLPQDFISAIYAEKRAIGSYNGATKEAEAEPFFEVECRHCFNTGFIFIRFDKINEELLMRCDCKHGADEYDATIPQWEPSVGSVFVRQTFPAEAFKPNIHGPVVVDGIKKAVFSSGVNERMDWWKLKKKRSQKFWLQVQEAHKNGET